MKVMLALDLVPIPLMVMASLMVSMLENLMAILMVAMKVQSLTMVTLFCRRSLLLGASVTLEAFLMVLLALNSLC